MSLLGDNLQIQWKKSAVKQFGCLPLTIQVQFVEKLNALRVGETASLDIKKVHGIDDCYRLKVDIYRCIFFLHKNQKMISVVLIAHRKDAYRLLKNLTPAR